MDIYKKIVTVNEVAPQNSFSLTDIDTGIRYLNLDLTDVHLVVDDGNIKHAIEIDGRTRLIDYEMLLSNFKIIPAA